MPRQPPISRIARIKKGIVPGSKWPVVRFFPLPPLSVPIRVICGGSPLPIAVKQMSKATTDFSHCTDQERHCPWQQVACCPPFSASLLSVPIRVIRGGSPLRVTESAVTRTTTLVTARSDSFRDSYTRRSETTLPSAGSWGLRPCWRSQSSGMPSPSVSSGAFSLFRLRPAAHFVLGIDHPILAVADALHDPLRRPRRGDARRRPCRARVRRRRRPRSVCGRAAVDVEFVIDARSWPATCGGSRRSTSGRT